MSGVGAVQNSEVEAGYCRRNACPLTLLAVGILGFGGSCALAYHGKIGASVAGRSLTVFGGLAGVGAFPLYFDESDWKAPLYTLEETDIDSISHLLQLLNENPNMSSLELGAWTEKLTEEVAEVIEAHEGLHLKTDSRAREVLLNQEVGEGALLRVLRRMLPSKVVLDSSTPVALVEHLKESPWSLELEVTSGTVPDAFLPLMEKAHVVKFVRGTGPTPECVRAIIAAKPKVLVFPVWLGAGLTGQVEIHYQWWGEQDIWAALKEDYDCRDEFFEDFGPLSYTDRPMDWGGLGIRVGLHNGNFPPDFQMEVPERHGWVRLKRKS